MGTVHKGGKPRTSNKKSRKGRPSIDSRCVPVDPFELFGRLAESLGVHDLKWYGKFRDAKSIVSLGIPDIDVRNADYVRIFRDRYLLKEVLRKYPGFDLGIDRSRVALDSFWKAEGVNRATNERLSSLPRGIDPRVLKAYSLSCRKAAEIAGRLNVRGFIRGARFGPGATTGTTAAEAAVPLKLSKVLDVTHEAKELAYLYLTTAAPSWAVNIYRQHVYRHDSRGSGIDASTLLREVESDRAELVPKSAKTDRLIFVQPCANAVLQLGVGRALRERMYSWGINLQDQSINQNLAREASKTGQLATVDLENASNSMSKLVVWDHFGNFPIRDGSRTDSRWYVVADLLRTRFGKVDGRLHEFEMFSAMGNGFTFEMESLIFHCLATATCEVLGIKPLVSVYGDDIILPVAAMALFRKVLSHAGFAINEDKTSDSVWGPLFRESCGGHYLDGFDVTPVYVDKVLDTEHEIILLANNLRRWASNGSWGCDRRLQPVYEWIVSHLSKRGQRTAVPNGMGDEGLVKDFDEARPSVALRQKARKGELYHPPPLAWYSTVLVRSKRKKIVRDERGLVAWLFTRETGKFSLRDNTLEGRLARMFPKHEPIGLNVQKEHISVKRRVIHGHWRDIGPWL
jgi:hypothetical protein